LFELGLHTDAVDVFEDTEKDGKLPVLTVAFADFEDLPPALGVADVVANEVAAAHETPPEVSVW
jgi:hypothetical protein